MAFKFNPIEGTLDLVGDSGGGQVVSYKNSAVTYLDEGLRTQRIGSIEFELFDDATQKITSTISWLDVGTMNQRIEKEVLAGSLLNGQSFEKIYVWRSVGIRYVLDGFEYQVI